MNQFIQTYLSRQRADIEDFKKEEGLKIPKIIEYKKVGSLSNEIIEKLTKNKTTNAWVRHQEISGVTPAAIIAIMRYIKKKKNNKAA